MDWKSVVSTVAPWIGGALSGPLGAAAASAAAAALGLSDTTEAALKAAVTGASTEQLTALKAADQQFAAKMQELGYKNHEALATLAVADTASARDMQVSTKSWAPPVLSLVITLGFFGVTYRLLTEGVPEGNNEVLYVLIGQLSLAWAAVVNFNLGSTLGSMMKTGIIARSPALK